MKLPVGAFGAVKLIAKIPPGVAVKIPAPKPFVPPPVPPSSSNTTPAPNTTAAPKKKFRSGENDDDDDAYALISGSGRSAAPSAPNAVAAKPKPQPAPTSSASSAPRQPLKQVRRVERAPSTSSSSSSSDEDDDDEEGISLFKLAKIKGAIPVEGMDELLQEEVAVPTGPPPRPPIQKRFTADVEGAIKRLRDRLQTEEAKARIKDDNKTVSLGTSKVNYIDPRIICSWCKRENVTLSKVFSATLQKKFPWARDIGEEYEF